MVLSGYRDKKNTADIVPRLREDNVQVGGRLLKIIVYHSSTTDTVKANRGKGRLILDSKRGKMDNFRL